jgi:hypothetical protein
MKTQSSILLSQHPLSFKNNSVHKTKEAPNLSATNLAEA